ncbi:uncharacterized protein FIBRA_07357 [Fibroporia radiculosa]|uniref:Mediator of RNA polymerase II transcription subunit 5 n=1 Tax=Fibroporia radiculosa TaxID=599839 RepID=J4GE71_9APHY|nr:uncharacterized protein FIBRA_07357 [Fibroporia radiculosa]CCM05148.1 predicted protein [Fibroporia radiculosa]
MFSQWRQAVENLAQHPPRQDSADERQSRSSLDTGLRASLSSAQLAESALSNIKKTLAAQRSGSPSPSLSHASHSPGADIGPKRPASQSTTRTTLEDRLRAKFAISDNSSSPTPVSSSGSSPSLRVVIDHPLSPTSAPLPESPAPQRVGSADPFDALSKVRHFSPTASVDDTTSNVSASLPAARGPTFQTPPSPALIPLPDSPALAPTAESPVPLDSLESQCNSGGDSAISVDQGGTDVVVLDEITGDATKSVINYASLQDHVVGVVDDTHGATVFQQDQHVKDSGYAPTTIALPSSVEEHDGPGDLSPGRSTIEADAKEYVPDAPLDTITTAQGAKHIRDAQPIPSNQTSPHDWTGRTIPEDVASKSSEPNVEELQRRLKLVEQRFAVPSGDDTDVSTSFKRLQAEKIAADKVVKELTPLETLKDVDALRDYLQNVNIKTEMAQDEIRRLSGKLTRQEERIDELREIHRLESKSQSDQIEKLKGQVSESEALLKASQSSNVQVEEEVLKWKAETERLQSEMERLKGLSKEEEEKRVKAVALLKTVRQKLVKAEKERDDAIKDTQQIKEKDKEELEKDKAEKLELRQEIERANTEHETALVGLKLHFEKESVMLKDRQEKELLAVRGQYELEALAVKSSYTRELEVKDSRIRELQNSVRVLNEEKDEFFDQLQLRQAELESSRSRLEVLEGQTTEFQYQLREANDRIALLSEELADARREQDIRPQNAGPSAEEVTRLLSAAEAKYETRMADMRRRLSAVEKERDEGEAQWSRKLSEKVKELESLRGSLHSSTRSREEESESANALRKEIQGLKGEILAYQQRVSDLQVQADTVAEAENATKSEIAENNARMLALQQTIEESKNREAQVRAHNKTLREELRKVQSSAALLERQRNPGVGYWASRQENTADARSPRSSISESSPQDHPSRPGSPATPKSDEDLNVEYLRNVILQFLEHKEMRYEISNWNILDSVLVLFRNYPGDPGLQGYLKRAVEDQLLTLSRLVSTFLSAARSPELHNPATLDMLCRIALDSYYASGLPAMGSIVPYTQSNMELLGTVQDSMALLRTAHTLPLSQFNQLFASASELLSLLLSCVADISQISTTQAMMYFAEASDVLQVLRLPLGVRQQLENFALSLSLLLGDDAKAMREAQMMHTLQLAWFCTASAGEFGAGASDHAVAVLVGLFRWTSWTPVVFYTQLLHSALTCIAQTLASLASSRTSLIWRALIVGRLPHLFSRFQKEAETESGTDADWRTALQAALSSVLRRSDILSKYETSSNSHETDLGKPRTSSNLAIELLHEFVTVGLVDASFATTLCPTLQNDFHSPLTVEAQDAGSDVRSYLESKFAFDANLDDIVSAVDRICRDPCSHSVFADIVLKRCTPSPRPLELDSLSQMSRVLTRCEPALDIIALHVNIPNLITHVLAFVEDYDCETVGDPQTAVSHLGDVVLFVQEAVARFNFSYPTVTLGDRKLDLAVIRPTAVVYPVSQLGHDSNVFYLWFKALFDTNSEGIEDTILRTTRPQALLRIAATLFSHAIAMTTERKMDKEILQNGILYFLGPLLNWTLSGVVNFLIMEIQHRGFNAPVHIDVLQTLLSSSSCPPTVLRLSASKILRLFPNSPKNESGRMNSLDFTAIRHVAMKGLGVPVEGKSDPPLSLHAQPPGWSDLSLRSVRDALTAARSGKAPALDIDRCLLLTPPAKFLHMLWKELMVMASLGEIDISRRIATFVLTMPRRSHSPPLLPIFLHVLLPGLVAAADSLPSSDPTVTVELLVTVVSSSLTAALHLEYALLKTDKEHSPVLGQTTAAMARRLGSDLRRKGHGRTAALIVQRLCSISTFMTNFPTFMADV